MKLLPLIFLLCASCASARAQTQQWGNGRDAILSLAGCYLVDYSYVETEALKEGYALDKRVYDVNLKMSNKEWVYAQDLGPGRVWLQHILFAANANGVIPETLLKHEADDWQYNAPYLYAFTSPGHWSSQDLHATPDVWTRRITNLDDGPRYQCAAPWSRDTLGYPEWRCSTYAPIPGRETRDMSRKDYNTLQRSTRVVAYQSSWLERQDNKKTLHTGETLTPIARELGKNWYVRLPDSDCAAAQAFAKERMHFWAVLREVWDEVLNGRNDFAEVTPAGQGPRFFKMAEVEEAYLAKDLTDPTQRDAAKRAIREVIDAYRVQ